MSSQEKPLCANCGGEYIWHRWRSGKGACPKPPAGKKTVYQPGQLQFPQEKSA